MRVPESNGISGAARRARGWVRRTVMVGMVAVTTLGGVVSVGSSPAAAEGGIRYEAYTTYRVDPAGGAVRVAVDITATNQTPNSVSGGYVRQYYYTSLSVPVLAEIANTMATREGGGALSVTVEPSESDRVSIARIDLSPNLFYGQTQHIHFTYDLPSQPARSDAFTRVNPAYATFAAIATGDPGLSGIEIVVPDSFDVEAGVEGLTREVRSGEVAFKATAISDPDFWGVLFAARDDDALVSRRAEVSGRDVEIRAWPGDDDWMKFVRKEVGHDLPSLEDVIGQPWPRDAELDVTETVSPYLYGYAGWYTSADNSIEIGDALDSVVIAHELAHIWFNDQLFDSRWIDEGLAEEYGTHVLHERGRAVRHPHRVAQGDSGYVALNDWNAPAFRDDQTDAQENFGYNASWFVIRNLADEIGFDKLADVIDVANERRLAYAGDGERERNHVVADWKRFLDLLEEVGGSEKAADIFEKYVANRDDAGEMRSRALARDRYAGLVKAGGEWAPPLVVRKMMAGWSFDRARSLIEDAKSVLEVRDEIARTIDPLGMGLPDGFEQSYEASDSSLGGVAEEARVHLHAAKEVAAADRQVRAHRSPLETVGLIGSRAERKRDEAVRAFEKGKDDSAVEAAHDATEIIDGAGRAGAQRAAAGGGVILVAGGSMTAI